MAVQERITGLGTASVSGLRVRAMLGNRQAKELLQGFAVSRRWENKDGLDAGGERSYFCLWLKHGDPNSQPMGTAKVHLSGLMYRYRPFLAITIGLDTRTIHRTSVGEPCHFSKVPVPGSKQSFCSLITRSFFITYLQ
jgi:hypothetical protein